MISQRGNYASRPKFWPWPRLRPRNLWPRDPLASASSFWSRPRTLIFNFKEPGVLSFRNTSEQPSKNRRTALFGHYREHHIRTPLTNHRNNSPDISSSSTLTVLTQQLNPLHSQNFILTSHYCNLYFSICSVCQPVLLQ